MISFIPREVKVKKLKKLPKRFQLKLDPDKSDYHDGLRDLKYFTLLCNNEFHSRWKVSNRKGTKLKRIKGRCYYSIRVSEMFILLMLSMLLSLLIISVKYFTHPEKNMLIYPIVVISTAILLVSLLLLDELRIVKRV